MPTFTLRKLTHADVTFNVFTEPEDLDPAEQFDDPETLADIQRALARGMQEAWCCLVVEAKWGGWTGHATLGGVSLLHGESFKVYAADNGLYADALETLNREIAGAAQQIAMLVTP